MRPGAVFHFFVAKARMREERWTREERLVSLPCWTLVDAQKSLRDFFAIRFLPPTCELARHFSGSATCGGEQRKSALAFARGRPVARPEKWRATSQVGSENLLAKKSRSD